MPIVEVKQRLIKKIKKLTALPTLDASIQKIMEVAQNPKSSAAEMEEVISKDQSLSGKVLKIVNSAYYGFPRQIDSISQAIVVLGFQAIKNLALTSSVKDMFKESRKGVLDMKSLWLHSMATAIASETIAEYMGYQKKEEAFTAGLLHDIGKLVMNIFVPELREVVEKVKKGELTFFEAEQETLDINHAVVGKYLLDIWNLPNPIVMAVLYHHEPMKAEDILYADLVKFVYLADNLVKIKRYEAVHEGRIRIEADVWNALGMTPKTFWLISKEVGEKIKKARDVFGI